MKQRGKDLKA